jgi:YVTN family beta-propeller protein
MTLTSSIRLAIAALFAVQSLQAQSTPPNSLLVLLKNDKNLLIVDPASLKPLALVSAGQDPHEVIASADGRLAYISNYGGGALNTLTVIDIVGQKSVTTVDLGGMRGPHGLSFVGGKVWFTAEGSNAVGSYDPKTKKTDWIFGTGQARTHMIWVSADQKLVATSNVNAATISLIDRTTASATTIPVGRGVEGFDVSPDGKELWAANATDGTVSIIDIASQKVTQTLNADVGGANRLKFTPNGALVLISTLRGSDVTVYDVATRTVKARIKVGSGAAGIQMQPDGARAFVACTPDNYVAVIDLRTLTVAGRIDTGKEPDGLAWAVRPSGR